MATASLLVPWGANARVQVSGGGLVKWWSIPFDLTNPAAITCLTWSQVPGSTTAYNVSAYVYAPGKVTVPAAPVTFSVLYPVSESTQQSPAVLLTPTSSITDVNGKATTLLALEQEEMGVSTWGPTQLPVVVAASIGSSVMPLTIAAGVSPPACP
jgi:hypothetical protein